MSGYNFFRLAFLGLLALSCHVTAYATGLHTIGWVEEVTVDKLAIRLDAKIDSGADNSSLHASDVQFYQKQGREWIRFKVKSKEGDTAYLENPVVRYVRIKQKQGVLAEPRPVVRLGVCLDKEYRTVDVNLVDRGNFSYPLLIGRSFLAEGFLINAGAKNLTSPRCNNLL